MYHSIVLPQTAFLAVLFALFLGPLGILLAVRPDRLWRVLAFLPLVIYVLLLLAHVIVPAR